MHHYNPLLITKRSWILAIHKVRIFLKVSKQRNGLQKWGKKYTSRGLWWRANGNYCKVLSSRLSRLVALPRIFRRLMKGKFDAYELWPLATKFQNWIVDRSTARDLTVIYIFDQYFSFNVQPENQILNRL